MNDTKLIKECQKGNKKAFNELITYYYPFVLKYLLKITNNKDLSEDLVQETFLKVIKNIDSYNISSNSLFTTYLISIAKHSYIDYLRKNKKELQEEDIETYTNTISSEQDYFKNEDYNHLMNEINKLLKDQKEAVILKYIKGYKLEEIALYQKVQSKTIKSRLFEAKKKLKKFMKGYDIYE